ncbi:hypothetical protein [Glaciibacter superstes]|uniref:hypothetical protein n=1 Tax=Glaciibacter superstes TaxID=501023 RepID=UPI0003B61329|nr:hypothetical protein [Glaciibacter superstes]
MTTDLVSVANELYALPSDEFVAARNARAKAARDSGDKDLAVRIGELTKPSAAAWAVNMLVRHSGDQVDQLIDLGASLRQAQKELDPVQLRELTRQRQKLVAALGTQARSVAEELGKKPSNTAIDEVGQTLQAALTDPDAAIAVQSGRLIRTLTGTGWEPVDLSGAVAVPPEGLGISRQDDVAGSRSDPKKASGPKVAAEKRKSGSAKERDVERQRREASEARELREQAEEADRKADAARSDLGEIEGQIDDLATQRQQVTKELGSLRDRIAALEEESADLSREVRSLERERKAASRAFERAEREARAGHDRDTN